jgi:perosamine synthetase
MIVHVYGRIVDMERVHRVAERYNLLVVEDMAEAHGAKPHPKTHAVCHSFFKNKIIAGQEGGAVWFRNPMHATLARQLRNLGFTDAHDFRHIARGHNYRMSNAHAELVLESLAKYPDNLRERRRLEALHDTLCPADWKMPPRDAPWVMDFRVPGMREITQDRLVQILNSEGVAARHCFRPMHEQEEYRSCRVVGNGNAARLAREVIYLPLTPGQVTDESVRRAWQIIGRVLGRP